MYPRRFDLVIRSRSVVTPTGARPAAVAIRDGVIERVTDREAVLDADHDVDLPAGQVLLPGLVDTHVHVNEPGRTEWEGFASATRAAAAGGVTTLVDMPLNSVPATTDPCALAIKLASAAGRVRVDVAFWGGAVPQNLGALGPLHDAGVLGFKCFLAPSGVDEFEHLDRGQLWAAQAELAALSPEGALLVVHAEDPGVLAAHEAGPGLDGRVYAHFVATRPPAAETAAIADVIEGLRRYGGRAHILHLSAADALPQIRAAKAEGLRLTVETCPHYLTLDAAEVPDGATQFKCCPPVRDEANRDLLWAGLADGTIDCIVSDHSPSTVDLKYGGAEPGHGDFGVAWGGIAGLQLGLPAVWTEARRRGVPLGDVVRWMSSATADLVGLTGKGRIAPGADADLVALAPDETFRVDAARLEHRHPVTAYDGRELTGVVHATWLRGQRVDRGAGDHLIPVGRLVRMTKPGGHTTLTPRSHRPVSLGA